MRRRIGALPWTCLAVIALAWLVPAAAIAAPQISNLSLRGIQAGGLTTLVIEGSQLGPEARLLLNTPGAHFTIKDGATDRRLEVECKLDGATPAGIYLLRVASAQGVSQAVALGVDNLAQLPFAAELAGTNVALSSSLQGSQVLATTFVGKKDQRVVVEVESRRLGSELNPSVHVYGARRRQLAWSQGLPALAGDARCVLTLPEDGTYTIELHDALFRGGNPGFFRLKIGDFRYADLVFPLAVQPGAESELAFVATNLPEGTAAKASSPETRGLPQFVQPAPWPKDLPLVSGSRPRVIVSSHAEVLEAAPADKPQELSAAPVAINGRLGAAGEHDRYRLAVTPGATLRFDVLAHRVGSPLDGVLSIQNEQGAELAANDDRPGMKDPGLDFKVPEGVSAVLVALRDLQKRGGADFVYRLAITPAGQPDYSLALESDRYNVPKDGAALVRVRADRAGYNGPIKLNFDNLPTSVSITGDEIPAGATQALVTLSGPGLNPAQSLAQVTGIGDEGRLVRRALPPANTVTTHQPWLRDDVAVAVTTPSRLDLVWDLFPTDTKLALGTPLPVRLRVARAEGATGPVRLSLLTTQVTPRKKVKVNNQDREEDDIERTLRFEAAPTIAADAGEIAANILVPADLPQIPYDLAIQAELLSPDGKSVVATAVTPARRMSVTVPVSLELAASGPVEARAGLGATGSVTGKVHRIAGFAGVVNVTLEGLPKGVSAPLVTVPADKGEFHFPLTFPYGTPEGELSGVTVVGTSLVDPKNPKSLLRTAPLPLAVKVVPGEKPPVEQPLAVFEDQPEFVANLTEGGGQASLVNDQKYSGNASVKVTPDQRYNPALPGLNVKIREKPGPGEYRYLRFAWKKQGGQAICLQLNHDGQWGPTGDRPGKFRYHAGGGGECFGASLALDGNLPAEFVVVTRDLFADFGEFTLTGLALSPVDGDFALFDHIYLATTLEDFELVKPK